MIRPVNGHILIEPLKEESFMASQKEVYEEVGVVIDIDTELLNRPDKPFNLKQGDRVYFDSYLAAKYPSGTADKFFWLVKWEDVRSVEYAEEIPK